MHSEFSELDTYSSYAVDTGELTLEEVAFLKAVETLAVTIFPLSRKNK